MSERTGNLYWTCFLLLRFCLALASASLDLADKGLAAAFDEEEVNVLRGSWQRIGDREENWVDRARHEGRRVFIVTSGAVCDGIEADEASRRWKVLRRRWQRL